MSRLYILVDYSGVTGFGLHASIMPENCVALICRDLPQSFLPDGLNIDYYTNDKEAYDIICKYADKYESVCVLPVSDRGLSIALEQYPTNVTSSESDLSAVQLLNKKQMSLAAQNAGLNVPQQIETLCLETALPVIVKPINSLVFGKEEFKILSTQQDVANFLAQEVEFDYLVEEYIVGATQNMLEVMGQFTSATSNDFVFIDKICQSPPLIGSSSYVKSVLPRQEIVEKLRIFFENIKYVGLFDVEFKYCEIRKKYFYIETNFRAGAPVKLVTSTGVSLAKNFAQNTSSNNYRVNVSWMNDLTYPLSLSYVKVFLRSDCYAVYDPLNRREFLSMIKMRISNWIYR